MGFQKDLVRFCLCVSVANIERLGRTMEYEELTYAINGAVFEVNRILGPGFMEKVYENALLAELKYRGIKAESQVPIKIDYKGNIVGEYLADIVVDQRIIIELKATEFLLKVHDAQILNYLKATGLKLGLLVNFTYPKAEIKRFIL